MNHDRSRPDPRTPDEYPYISWHYNADAIKTALAVGRRFYDQSGVWLRDRDAIHLAFKRDGVVISRSK